MKKFAIPIALFAVGCLLICLLGFLDKHESESRKEGGSMSPAESLFYAYDGNHSAMANDGVYDEYKTYNVSHEQESIWFKEILEGKRNEVIGSDKRGDTVKVAYCGLLNALRQGKMYMANYKYEYEQIVKSAIEYLSKDNMQSLTDESKLYVYSAVYETLDNIDDFVDCGDYAFGLRYHLLKLQHNSNNENIIASAEALFNKTYSIQEWEDAE